MVTCQRRARRDRPNVRRELALRKQDAQGKPRRNDDAKLGLGQGTLRLGYFTCRNRLQGLRAALRFTSARELKTNSSHGTFRVEFPGKLSTELIQRDLITWGNFGEVRSRRSRLRYSMRAAIYSSTIM